MSQHDEHAHRSGKIVCALDELTNPGARAFSAGAGDWPLRGFVVRHGERVFAYVNRCPHAGHPLNWRPDQFLSRDQSLIQCSSHGAQFALDTGECVAGPCVGRSLTPLETIVENGLVVLVGDVDTLARAHA